MITRPSATEKRGHATIGKFTHLAAVASELNQRHTANGNWKLKITDSK